MKKSIMIIFGASFFAVLFLLLGFGSGIHEAQAAAELEITSAVITDTDTVVMTFNHDLDDQWLANYYSSIVQNATVRDSYYFAWYHISSFSESSGVVTFVMENELPAYMGNDRAFFGFGSTGRGFVSADDPFYTLANITQWPLTDGIHPYLIDWDSNENNGTVAYDDVDGSGAINQGDTIIITFNEDLNRNTLSVSNVNSRLFLSNGHIYGTTGNGMSLNWFIDGLSERIRIALGSDTTVAAGDTLLPSGEIQDPAGNYAIGAGIIAIPASDNVDPVPVSARAVDATHVEVTFSEDLNVLSVNKNKFSISGTSILSASETSKGLVTLVLGTPLGTGNLPSVSVNGTAVTDVAGNLTWGGTVSTSDGIPPTASITYSDSDAKVKSGDMLTITANFSEMMSNSPIPQITISGINSVSATNMTKVDSSHYSYIHAVGSGNGTANVALSTGRDLSGNLIVSNPTSGASFTVDNIAPVLSETTPVSSPTTDNTPEYTFNSGEEGTITYGGGCLSSTTNALAGQNTITFNALSNGTYNNCTIRVTDSAGNQSSVLAISAFTVAVPDFVSTPNASPGGGTYSSTQSVTLSTATVGATIYYTTNGSVPTTSSAVYSGAISISQNTTLQAIAVKSGMSDSSVMTSVYQIKVTQPDSSVINGTYDSPQSVTLSSGTPDAAIYFTTNGTTPTTSSAQYVSPIIISSNTTLQAIAVKSGMTNSDVMSRSYLIKAAKPVMNPISGTFGVPQSITLSTTTAGATIYYTTDWSTPTLSSSQYSSPINISVPTAIRAIAMKNGMANSDMSTEYYSFRSNVPEASPKGGSYNAPQQVSLSTSTPESLIYYTTNGSVPTTSSAVYSGAISISQNTTLQAIAVKSGMSDSDVMTETYFIKTARLVASLAGGTYNRSENITLSTSTSGARIYYTTDGSMPTKSSNLYSSAIAISSSKTLKAIAVKDGMEDSDIMTESYTINTALKITTPTASPKGGTYTTIQTVTLSTATEGADIYYTTNGTTPTTSSTKYTDPITISKTQTVKAIAAKTGWTNSAALSATYTINLPQVAAPTVNPGAGTYNTEKTVTLYTTTAGADIYYTTDGTTPTSSSTKYTDPITISKTQTVKAIGVKYNYRNSAVLSVSYTIKPLTPTASPKGGTYTTIQTVTLSTATEGADIYYTTNGTTPTTSSTKYTDPITVSKTQTVKAIAAKTGWTNSAALSATYTINLPQVKIPVPSVSAGTYNTEKRVSLLTLTSGADIYYTTDGSAPTTNSSHYTGPITISKSQTVKAIAVKYNYKNSDVMSATYTLKVYKPTASPAGGTYSSIQTVTLSTATEGADIYYTTNGTTPTTSSTKYTDPITVSKTQAVKAIAAKTGWTKSDTMSSAYTISIR